MSEPDPPSEQASGADPVGHLPVLLNEVLEVLSPSPGQTYLDCTLGRGGHALAIAPKLAPGGHVIGIDTDPANAAFSEARLTEALGGGEQGSGGGEGALDVAVTIRHANFVAARQVLDEIAPGGLDRVDLLLADLGFASTQMDDAARGFAFSQDGPLDMRLDPTQGPTAADLVNRLPETELADVIYQYGEERNSRRIARKIVEARKDKPILTTGELAQLVRGAPPKPHKGGGGKGKGRRKGGGGRAGKGGWRPGPRIDPATRTFMALRIAVNAELDSLDALLTSLPRLLAPGGIAAVISFHSLEDRRVKQTFRQWHDDGLGERITRKPIIAGEAEALQNPRSRSAKLRAFRFARR